MMSAPGANSASAQADAPSTSSTAQSIAHNPQNGNHAPGCSRSTPIASSRVRRASVQSARRMWRTANTRPGMPTSTSGSSGANASTSITVDSIGAARPAMAKLAARWTSDIGSVASPSRRDRSAHCSAAADACSGSKRAREIAARCRSTRASVATAPASMAASRAASNRSPRRVVNRSMVPSSCSARARHSARPWRSATKRASSNQRSASATSRGRASAAQHLERFANAGRCGGLPSQLERGTGRRDRVDDPTVAHRRLRGHRVRGRHHCRVRDIVAELAGLVGVLSRGGPPACLQRSPSEDE